MVSIKYQISMNVGMNLERHVTRGSGVTERKLYLTKRKEGRNGPSEKKF